jgi:hypothetical protein
MATAKKSSSKKSASKKATAKKAAAKKTTSKKSASKKSSVKKSAKKASVKKSAAKKSSAKRSSAKKSGGRKYDPSVGKRVEREMHEMHRGKLKSGRSGKKVTNPKQAIAIALSEKRREGAKVPRNPNK